MTRLTVIIPGYNTPTSLWRRCLNSVINACGESDEIICVDDGSDFSPRVIEEFSKQDSRIKLLRFSKNKGQSAARNAAMAMAKGEWVTFLDSDDEVSQGIYDKCLGLDMSTDIFVFGVRTIWQREKMFRQDSLEDTELGVLSAKGVRWLYDNRLFEYVWNKIYNRDFLLRNQISFVEDICPGEDTIFNLDCALHKARWHVVKDVGYNYYRMDGTSLSRYLPRRKASLQVKAERWKLFVDKYGDPHGIISDLSVFSEKDAVMAEWDNMWRKGTPFGAKERWRFVVAKKRILLVHPFVEYIRRCVCMCIRKHLYFGWVYKLHISRYYHDLVRYSDILEGHK